MSSLRVVMAGATGKTGLAVSRALLTAPRIEVVGAIARRSVGSDLGVVTGLGPNGIAISDDLTTTLDQTEPDVLVDFTTPHVAAGHARAALERGTAVVVGTTGLSSDDIMAMGEEASRQGVAAIVIPNFSLGALLLFRFAREAAKILKQVELIEMHHATKLDAPSGTAIRLAQSVASELQRESIPIHSVRLPGLVAHHSLIFGTDGETLTLTHDTLSRDAFGPGVVLAVRRTRELKGLVMDLDTLFHGVHSFQADSASNPNP